MRVLGIHDAYNACAAAVEDGHLIAVVQEERLKGTKNVAGFPHLAVREVLRIAGWKAGDVDFVALNGNHVGPPEDNKVLLRKFEGFSTPRGLAKRLLRSTPINEGYRALWRKRRREEVQKAGLDVSRVRCVEHHTAHAAAAYFGSPWRDGPVLVLTCDGGGDEVCASVNIGEKGRLTRLAAIPDSDSIGVIYAMITYMLGMMPHEHEYKVMGMAPYAPAKGAGAVYQELKNYLRPSRRNPLIWERSPGYPHTFYSYRFLQKLLERKRFDWICAGLQRFTEELLTGWVSRCVRETGVARIALSGGVGMNVKANKGVAELDSVESLFVFPSCGDESNAIGAAWYVFATERQVRGEQVTIPPIGSLYLGPEFSEQECEYAIRDRRNGFTVRRMDYPEGAIADLLAAGEVVARFDGRMEFGARALGNRSILANPSDLSVVRLINDMIKSRDFWMPFAPSILDYAGPRYIHNPKHLRYPYMILAFDSNGDTRDFHAATHLYDRTVRPQEVYENWNPRYYRLIQEFERRTGKGIILNTSFNLHGFPLVASPGQALDVFEQSGLSHLALGPFLLSKV